MGFLRNAWYAAAWAQELKPGALLARIYLGEPVVLFRREDGGPVAMADICPHRFAPLSRGELLPGDILRCMYHGLEFSCGGACVRNPHGDGAIPRGAAVRTYPVAERHSLVWIWMGERRPDEAAIPDFSMMDPQSSLATHRDALVIAADYRLLADNLMDLSHAAFLHEGILSSKEAAWAEIKVEQRGNTLWCSRWMPDTPIAKLHDLLYRRDGKPVDQWTHIRWDPPGCLLLDAGVQAPGDSREQGFAMHLVHFLTPENERSTHYLFGFAGKPVALEDQVREQVASLRRFAFEMQDKPMMEGQQKNMNRLGPGAQPALIASIDSGPMRMQRILDQLIAQEQARP